MLRVLAALPLTAVLTCAGCTSTGDESAPSPPATVSGPAAPTPTTGATPWQRPVSRLVVDGSGLTGMVLLSELSAAAAPLGRPWASPLVVGPEPAGEHEGRLTAWFDRELEPAQERAVLSAVSSAEPAAAGPVTTELSTEPSTNLELVFTPAGPPPAPTASPWPQEVGDRLAGVLTQEGGMGVFGAHGLDEGRYAFTYRGPQLADEAIPRLRDVLATVADEAAADIVARSGEVASA